MGASTSTQEPPSYAKAMAGPVYDFRLNENGAHALVELFGQSHNPVNGHIRQQLVQIYHTQNVKEPFFTPEALAVFQSRAADLVDAYGQLMRCLESPFKTKCITITRFIDEILCISHPHYFPGGASFSFLNGLK